MPSSLVASLAQFSSSECWERQTQVESLLSPSSTAFSVVPVSIPFRLRLSHCGCMIGGLQYFLLTDISLISPLFASLANSISEIGIRMGLAFTLIAFAGLAGTPINGALLTSHLLWARPIGFGAACLFLGCILLVIARHLTAKQKGTWKV